MRGQNKLNNTNTSSCQERRMTKGKAVTVLGLSERNVSCLVLTTADLLTAFRREISVVEGGRDELQDLHLAYTTLLTRVRNNKIKLRKEKRR